MILANGLLTEVEGVLYAKREGGRGWQRLRLKQSDSPVAPYVADATHAYPFQVLQADGQAMAFPLYGFEEVLPESLVVALDGSLQRADAYSLVGGVLTFVAPPPPGVEIYVRGVASTLLPQFNALLAALREVKLMQPLPAPEGVAE